MTNELSVFGNVSMSLDTETLLKNLETTQDEGARGGDVSFMSFSGKKGRYSIGVDKREPGPQELFLISIPAFETGYMAWKGGKPAGKRMATSSQPSVAEPNPEENGPFDVSRGEGWSRARSLTAKSMDNGEQVYFTTSSKSGVASMADLHREVVDRLKSGQPCWPAVVFGSVEFTAQGNTNEKPTMEALHWFTTEQVQTLADPDVDPMSLIGDTAQTDDGPPEPRKRRL